MSSPLLSAAPPVPALISAGIPYTVSNSVAFAAIKANEPELKVPIDDKSTPVPCGSVLPQKLPSLS